MLGNLSVLNEKKMTKAVDYDKLMHLFFRWGHGTICIYLFLSVREKLFLRLESVRECLADCFKIFLLPYFLKTKASSLLLARITGCSGASYVHIFGCFCFNC